MEKVITDYYAILGVPHTATTKYICSAYRKLALQYHPSLTHSNSNLAYHRFCQASEAFDVLYDPDKKRIYDHHGYHVLKYGMLHDDTLSGKYRFTTDAYYVFEKFFGSRNVYEHLLYLTNSTGNSHPLFHSQYYPSIQYVPVVDLIVPVHCLLSYLYNGCKKILKYQKQVITKDGKHVENVLETKEIEIYPGASKKHPIVFEQQGHAQPGYSQSKLVFQIVEIDYNGYRREDNNLIYTAKVGLMAALDSKPITVKQLNGYLLQLTFDEIISPQTRRVIYGKGMPVLNNNKKKHGDLIIVFDIQFPEYLPQDKKNKIVQLLRAV